MHDSDNNPETLISVPNDLEAAMIVSVLAAHDVDATTSGGFTAGFRAEAPGEVQVLVRHRDLSKAREALWELDSELLPNPAEQFQSSTATTAESKNMWVWLTTVILLTLLAGGIVRSFF